MPTRKDIAAGDYWGWGAFAGFRDVVVARMLAAALWLASSAGIRSVGWPA